MYCCNGPNCTAIQTVHVECDRMNIYILFLSSDLIISFVSLGSVPYSLLHLPLNLMLFRKSSQNTSS